MRTQYRAEHMTRLPPHTPGVGLLGILAAACGAAHVRVTDVSAVCLQNIRDNVHANGAAIDAARPAGSAPAAVRVERCLPGLSPTLCPRER